MDVPLTKSLMVLRVLSGLATIGLGVWLFVRFLPVLNFEMLVLFLVAGFAIIEAPRLLNTFRQRKERRAAYIDANEPASSMLDRANRFRRWGLICYAAAFVWIFIGFALLGPQRLAATVGIAIALFVVGSVLRFYRWYAETSVEFRAVSAAKPKISQAGLWITTVGLLVVIAFASVAQELWRVDAVNWLFGALGLSLVGAFIWRWVRGWPDDRNPPS